MALQPVFIRGVGMTPFARFPDRSMKDLAREAVDAALTDAGIGKEELQAEVTGLNSGLEPEDGRYQIVPLFLGAATPAADAPLYAEMLAALQSVGMDAVGVGGGENTISDAARAKVDAVLEKIGAPWPSTETAAAAPVVLPESDEQVKELMVLVGKYGSAVEANSTGNPSNYTLASDESAAYEAIKAKLRALLATATGLPAQAVEKSVTHGMNLGQRILHVGGRENAHTYIEFGSVSAVRALVDQVLRDFPDGAPGFAIPAPQAQADARDAELLAFLQDQCIDLRCFTTSDGEDVGWRTVQHHMSEPRERVVSEVYGDQPRRAIREAMARIERDPYCTGPLHLEDDAAIAAAKGE